jgi:hypothetical protein
MREIPCCFVCWPGGPVTPPPCRACGSTSDYYTSGLCARCHPHAPGARSPAWRPGPPGSTAPLRIPVRVVVDACPDCYAWGVTRTVGWVCEQCTRWRARHQTTSACATCGHTVAVDDDGSCRLCHKQRIILAHRLGKRPGAVSVADANRHGQQLFLATAWRARHAKRPTARIPPDRSRLRPVTHQQLVLLELPLDLTIGLRHGFPPPDLDLAAALGQFVRDYAVRYAWTRSKTERVTRAIRILLATQDTPGAPIRRSDVALLSRIKHSAAVVGEVLAAAGMLQEDREPAIVRWFALQTADLPTAMRHELGVWFGVMRAGSTTPPRQRPRADSTITNKLRSALPALRGWARTHPSLRAIGRDDVLAALPPSGSPRSLMLQGLRSIFRVLKGRKLVFVNPTARISAPTPNRQPPPPVDLDALRHALDSDNPATAVLTALLAFHAVRIWQLTQIRLGDLRDGRLHLGDRTVLLAEPVRQRLTAYLDFRQRTWPTSVNPYLFVHVRNADTDRHVTPWWIRRQLSIPGQRIRQDRILDEAHATGGDIRALCDLFGLSIAGAYRYTMTIDRIVEPTDRDDLAARP